MSVIKYTTENPIMMMPELETILMSETTTTKPTIMMMPEPE